MPIFDGIGKVHTQYSRGSFSYCNKTFLTNLRPSVIFFFKYINWVYSLITFLFPTLSLTKFLIHLINDSHLSSNVLNPISIFKSFIQMLFSLCRTLILRQPHMNWKIVRLLNISFKIVDIFHPKLEFNIYFNFVESINGFLPLLNLSLLTLNYCLFISYLSSEFK